MYRMDHSESCQSLTRCFQGYIPHPAGDADFSAPVFTQAAEKLMQLKEMNAFPEKFLEIGEVEAVQNFADGKAVLFPHQSTIVYHLLD